MSRIRITAVAEAPAASAPLLDAVHQQLGMVPNLMKLLSASPAALEGYLSLNGALGKGALPLALRERIALTVAQHNECDYCLAAHSYLGKNLAKLDASEIAAARDARAADASTGAALNISSGHTTGTFAYAGTINVSAGTGLLFNDWNNFFTVTVFAF